jgi:mycothiol synthase
MTISDYSDLARAEILDLWSRALPLDTVTEDILERRVLLDENFDPATFLLARENGTLAGFVIGAYAKRLHLGDADPQGTRSWITILAIDPDASVDTVGGTLLREVEQRFIRLGRKECWVSTYPPGYFTPGIDAAAYQPLFILLTGNGYGEQYQALSMDAQIVTFRISDTVEVRERHLKTQGIEVRPYKRSDLVRFLAFLESSMPDDWVRVERRNLAGMTEGRFSPDQITVVARGEEIIGYCQFEGSHFGPFGVSEEYQRQGIGTVLLARTIERMKRMGYHDAWVMWTDDMAAKVYAKLGFQETRRFSILRKKL